MDIKSAQHVFKEADSKSDTDLLDAAIFELMPGKRGMADPSEEQKWNRFLLWLEGYRTELCHSERVWECSKHGDRWSLYAAIADILGASGSATVVVLTARVCITKLCEQIWKQAAERDEG